mmetsp:Transcript_47815/g.125214  ORF Transcript_47815/g.125214 Transcript_47815/m.125214 type:complete len:100 (+) Transcript_47815:802-1101(+)
MDYDGKDSSDSASKKHKQSISFGEFSIAVKAILLGILAGKPKIVAEKQSKKFKDDMDPILQEAIASLEMKGFKPHGKKKKKKRAQTAEESGACGSANEL